MIVILLLSIILSYIIYPIYKKLLLILNSKISIIIIYIIIISIFIIFIYSIIPNIHIITDIINLFNNIFQFINRLNIKYNLNIDISLYLEKIINYIINNGLLIFSNVINYITKILFIIILSICLLSNIDKIKEIINNYKHKDLIYIINAKLKYYLIANVKILIIQFMEYTIIFLIVGHPNYLLLGILNSLNTFIPFVGALITNSIAIITASVISKRLLIYTAIVSIIMPQIDAYFITPKIYKESNKISQTLYIMTMILLGSIFKVWGVIISLPFLIIIIEIIKYKNIVKNN